MKKSLLILAGLALIASSALGQQVLSRNAVGYTRVDVGSNNLSLVGLPFYAFSNTVQGIFGSQLVGGSSFNNSDQVMRYNPALGTYQRYWKRSSDGLWLNADTGSNTDTFENAYGFWVRNRQSSNQYVYLMGEVPDRITAPTQDVQIVEGLNMPSYAFPVAVAITGLSFKSQAYGGSSFNNSDQLMRYDAAARSYKRYWMSSAQGTWVDYDTGLPTSDILQPGEGFWYRRRVGQSAFDWSEAKPYTWP